MSLHENMLSNDDVLAAIDLKVDYLMSEASLAEHGWNLIYVNHYELCAEHTLPQHEWWSFVHCMYGMQDCLNYNTTAANQTCAGAESGEDDDLGLSGTDKVAGTDCDCSLSGVASYCTTEHTSTDFATMKSCAYSNQAHEWAVKSKDKAEAVNSGSPLWLTVNNMTISLSTNEKKEITTWAKSAFSAVCDHIELGGASKPESCATI